MNIAVLGTGMVANAIATKLVHRGHQVMMGSRTANSDAGQEWLRSVGAKRKSGRSVTWRLSAKWFSTAQTARILSRLCARRARRICAARFSSMSRTRWIFKGNAANTHRVQYRFARRTGPKSWCNHRSWRGTITSSFAETTKPREAKLWIGSADGSARSSNIIDLGDITAARGTEMWMPIWLRLYGTFGHPHVNLRLILATK
jgi:8-hydroxy-5-deazaflavin:NADPH oxidoreductase